AGAAPSRRAADETGPSPHATSSRRVPRPTRAARRSGATNFEVRPAQYSSYRPETLSQPACSRASNAETSTGMAARLPSRADYVDELLSPAALALPVRLPVLRTEAPQTGDEKDLRDHENGLVVVCCPPRQEPKKVGHP